MTHTSINYVIRKGFYDKLIPSGSSTVKTALTQTIGAGNTATYCYKLFYHQAPQVCPGTTTALSLPYVVMDILPINQDQDTATKWYKCTVQFLVASFTASECEDIAGYLTDALEDCEATLTVTGYSVLEIRREPQINLGFNELVWNIAVQYSIIIQK